MTDRIASLEQRVQMQEDDIQLLKSALADVVRRLNITEEQQAMQNKKGPTKGIDLDEAYSNSYLFNRLLRTNVAIFIYILLFHWQSA